MTANHYVAHHFNMLKLKFTLIEKFFTSLHFTKLVSNLG